MKAVKKSVSILLALLLIIGALTIAPFTVGAATDLHTDITPYTFDTELEDYITSTTTAKHYKFTIPSSGRVSMTFKAANTVDKMFFDIENSNHDRVITQSFSKGIEGIISENHYYDLTAGTYFLVIRKSSDYTGSFKFTLSFSSANESFNETLSGSNNSYKTANTIAFNTKYIGQLAINDKVDYYKFNLSTSGRVNISLSTSKRHFLYSIMDSKLNTIYSEEPDNYLNTVSINKNIDLTSGTYYLVCDRSDNQTGTYNFTLKFTSANETFKEVTGGSNNDWKYANSISVNTAYKGQIAKNDELDCYKISIPTTGVYRLRIESEIQYMLFLVVNTDKTKIILEGIVTPDRYDKNTGKIVLDGNVDLNAGTYYVIASRLTDEQEYNQTGAYSFKFSKSISPTAVAISPTSVTLGKGESYTLTRKLTPSYATQSGTWSSSNTNVATVSSSGKVTAKNTGTATITVKTSNGKTATCKVTVKPAPTSVKTTPTSVTLGVGEKLTISESTNSGAYANASNLKWSSDNSSIASVAKGSSNKATITANKVGTTNVKITLYNGKTATCKVTVKPAPTSVVTNPTTLTLGVGEKFTITESSNSGSYANAANLKWISSSSAIASIVKGSGNKATITANKVGTTYVKITLYNGKTAQCKVVVKPAPTSVKTNPTSVTLGVGEKLTISESTNSGSYANATNLKWSSTNSAIASIVKGDGNKATITANKVGTTYVKITLYNGKTAQCKVIVKPAPTTVKTNPTSVTLKVGDKYTISESTNSGSYANSTNLKWSSLDTSIATVKKDSGNKATITAKSVGTTYVNITLFNGKTAQCKVTVK